LHAAEHAATHVVARSSKTRARCLVVQVIVGVARGSIGRGVLREGVWERSGMRREAKLLGYHPRQYATARCDEIINAILCICIRALIAHQRRLQSADGHRFSTSKLCGSGGLAITRQTSHTSMGYSNITKGPSGSPS
jgi:hypothetical protein